MMKLWAIETVDNERGSSYKYLAPTLKDAEEHRMEYCGWYCRPGDVDIVQIDQNLRELARIHYWNGKVWEYRINEFGENGELVGETYAVRKGKTISSKEILEKKRLLAEANAL